MTQVASINGKKNGTHHKEQPKAPAVDVVNLAESEFKEINDKMKAIGDGKARLGVLAMTLTDMVLLGQAIKAEENNLVERLKVVTKAHGFDVENYNGWNVDTDKKTVSLQRK